MIDIGKKWQNVSIQECMKVNAKLPLPKNEGEADKFREITGGDNTWIGITDLTWSGVKENWTDVEGNQVGNAYVNFRVTI